ncbi:MAG: sodium-dependent transporter [Cyclobacteriaceae bacterium]|nr:sodium-dependent transporter [Cyclobacteriaceae bacterium HetDA_MAG_MS6]
MAARGAFSNRLGFILAAAGSAVGLGNIWKFPFEVGLGGGAAFVGMYLLFCFLLCFPVMVTEVAIGRKTQKNAIGAFNSLGFKKWNFIGKLGIFCGILILSFYNVIAGWAFGYFFEMAVGNFSISQNFGVYTSNVLKVGAYAVVFMLFTAFFVSKGVSGGIERLAKILMPSLIFMIFCLVGYALTLPNAFEGIKFYLVPDLSEITMSTVGGALRQAFFSLSLGMGALITYGSYLSKSDNIVSSAAFITLADVGIAFIAGLMIFPLVAFNNGGDMSLVQSSQAGPALIFVTLPGVFETLGAGLGAFVGAFFFLLLSFAALTSTVSLLEVPVSYVVDEWKLDRKVAVGAVALLIFIIGLPSMLANGASGFFSGSFTMPGGSTDFLSLAALSADTLLLFGGFFIVTFAAYVWKKENLHEELAEGFDGYHASFVKTFIDFAISYVCPVLLAILFVLVFLNNFFGINLL